MLRYVTIQRFPLLNFFPFFLPSLFILQLSSSIGAQSALQAASPPRGSAAQSLSIADRVPADLSKDARLDHRISLHEVGTPFNILLKKMSTADLTLTVETESAEQKLHINIKQRSLRQLMQSVAVLFAGTWYTRQDGSGYCYEMNIQTVRRRRHWWGLFLGEREKAFAAMRASVLHAIRTPPQPPAKFVTDHTVEDGIDEETWRKIASEKAFFGKLPATLQEQIANQVDEVPWYNMRGLVASDGMDENALFVPLSAFPDDMQLNLKSLIHETQDNTPLEQTVCIRFSNFGNSVKAVFSTLSSSGIPRTLASMPVPLGAELLPLKLNQAFLPDEVKKRGKAAPPAWKELAAYHESHVWPNDLPKQYSKREIPDRIDMQEGLAESRGLEFVSDYYTAFGGVTNAQPASFVRPLKEELDWQAVALDISWKQVTGNDLYLFRSNRWYRDDLLETPAPIIQRLLAYKKRQVEQEWQWQKQATMSAERIAHTAFIAELDGLADAVHTLTPWQLFNGLANVVVPAEQIRLTPIEQLSAQLNAAKHYKSYPRQAFEMDTLGILMQYRTLMFYGSLSKEERAGLLVGRLDAASLTNEQQQQVRNLLPILHIIGPPRAGEPLLIGIRPDSGGYVGIPRMRLFRASPSS